MKDKLPPTGGGINIFRNALKPDFPVVELSEVAPQLPVVRWPCDPNGGPVILLQVRSPTLLGGQAWTPQRHAAPI